MTLLAQSTINVGESNNDNNNSGEGGNKKSGNDKDKFKGSCKELSGKMFDAVKCNQADECIKTCKTMGECITFVTNEPQGSF